MVPADVYDVFLSHHGADHAAVEEIARRLNACGIRPWLDSWNLVPGAPWQEGIEDALARCTTCAVFIGPTGIGPWQNEEMRLAIDRRVSESRGKFRVIPVLLPGAQRGERSSLPAFLRASTWVEYRQTLDDEAAFHRLMSGIKGIEPGPGPSAAAYEGKTPYRGLEQFDVDDWPFFFGRDAAVEWLLEDLRPGVSGQHETRFLAVIGPSGSGKSSLARAGLVASLKRGCLPGSADWPLVVCRPGADPLESLAVALAGLLDEGKDVSGVRKLMDDLRQDRCTLHIATRLALKGAPPDRRLLLLVDQFEEIFTLCTDEAVRQAAIDNLLYAANVAGGQAVIILALRADFYGRCASYASLAAALTDHQMLVTPMLESELREAIERPAQMAGAEFEPGLVERLLDDIEGQAGRLPLLEYALLELWNRRNGRHLMHAAYDEIGGVEGALPRRAEAVFAGLTPAEQQVCRRVFLALVQPNETGETTRRLARLADLRHPDNEASRVDGVVGKLSSKEVRLVTLRATPDGPDDPLVELAHEALIRNWPRLQGWIEEDRQALRIHREVREAAHDWEDRGRDPSYLYHGKRLRSIEDWIKSESGALDRSESAFIAASIRQQKTERRQRRSVRAALSVLSLAVFAVLGALGWMYWSGTGLFPRQESWIADGHINGEVWTLAAADPEANLLYAGTHEGNVFRKSASDPDWTAVLTPTVGAGIQAMTVSAAEGGVVYVGTSDGFVWRGADKGDHWSKMGQVGSATEVEEVAADPNEPGVLYATDGSSAALYKSMDSGKSWTTVTVADNTQGITGLAVRRGADGAAVLYVGGVSGYVWRSVDGGATWLSLDTPLPSGIYKLVAHPTDDAVVYAGALDGQLYKLKLDADGIEMRLLANVPDVYQLAVTPEFPHAVFFTGATDGEVYLVRDTEGVVVPETITPQRDLFKASGSPWLVAAPNAVSPLYLGTRGEVLVWHPSRLAARWLN